LDDEISATQDQLKATMSAVDFNKIEQLTTSSSHQAFQEARQ
jgi:hypothetical protein